MDASGARVRHGLVDALERNSRRLFDCLVLAGILVDLVFSALGLIPQGPRPPSAVEHTHIIWNYTSCLDVAAAIFTAWLLFLHFKACGKQNAHATHCR